MKLLLGDCKIKLKELEDNSVDSICCDPPYELGFMGKGWDSTGIAYDVEMWKECLRVLKPGGYLLSFSGTRTYHRMAVAIEDAGFEVRDMIEWVYGSGFPKSLNIGKAVDKKPNIHLASQMRDRLNEYRLKAGLTTKQINEHFGFATTGSGVAHHWLTHPTQPTVPTKIQYQELKKLLNIEDISLDDLYIETERELLKIDKNWGEKGDVPISGYGEFKVTKGVTEYEGWGTALKPAHEPICMARKPLAEKTVAENCLKWGTGGINIDISRVEHNEPEVFTNRAAPKSTGEKMGMFAENGKVASPNQMGRFPANLIHDNSEEVRECFPETGKSTGGRTIKRSGGGNVGSGKLSEKSWTNDDPGFGDSGNASRFFKSIIYQAKASKSERNKGCEGLEEKPSGCIEARNRESGKGQFEGNKPMGRNNHPTVKPIALMEYLIKMVTPKGGVVLDPFMGSCSTGVACKKNGFDFIGIEMEAEYMKIAEARMEAVKEDDPKLFD